MNTTKETEPMEEEKIYQEILEKLKVLESENDTDKKIEYLNSIKFNYKKELKVFNTIQYDRFNINESILIIEEYIKKTLVKLYKNQFRWYQTHINLVLINIITYIGFFFTIIGFPITLKSINSVNRELNKQWEVTNKQNLISRYETLLEKALSYKENENISVVDFKALMSYINESDTYFLSNQKQKYKDIYKKKFDEVFKDVCILGYPLNYTEVKKEEVVNCLNDLRILIPEKEK